MRCSAVAPLCLWLLAGAAHAQYYGGQSALSQLLGGQGLASQGGVGAGGQGLLGQGMAGQGMPGQGVSGQGAGRSVDPCRPQAMSGSAFGLLASALTQGQRDRECVAERQAQWAEYNARQKAAKDQQDAAALQKQQKDDATAKAQVTAHAQQAETASRAARRRAMLAAQMRQERREASEAAQEAARNAAETRRSRAVTLVRAENAPGNVCRAPKLARGVMQGWNGMDAFKELGVQVIDIEHVTTVYFHPDDETFACHGVFVTNRGWRVAGTATMKRNVAGDAMFVWSRDASQDMAAYDARPQEDASSPEMASQVKVSAAPAEPGPVATAAVQSGGR